MPARTPLGDLATTARLAALGSRIRRQRKALRVSAAATAEAAGLSRVTLHRIERGEASVTMGAWLNVLNAVGLALDVDQAQASDAQAVAAAPPEAKRARRQTRGTATTTAVTVADYPQLKQLSWPLGYATVLTAQEALSLYERNWRHIDAAAMDPGERALLDSLVSHFGNGQLLV